MSIVNARGHTLPHDVEEAVPAMTEQPETTSPDPVDQGQDQDWSWVDEVQEWVPPSVDVTKPSVARIYDFGLGGKDNYPVDRAVAEKFLAIVPDGQLTARANRDFLTAAVREMAEAGIDQFLDLGSGLPTSPNVHETAREVRPGASVAYVDNDPVVAAHNRAMLLDDDRIVTISRDMRDPASVLGDPQTLKVVDFDRPVGLLFIAVLHFVDIASAPAILSRYVRTLAPGSLVAITATTTQGVDPQASRLSQETYTQATGTALVHRTPAEIEALFEGTDLLRPLVNVYQSSTIAILGGIGVKP